MFDMDKCIEQCSACAPAPIFEIVPARKYYGRHAIGSVLLRNGQPEFHAGTSEVKSSHKEYLKQRRLYES